MKSGLPLKRQFNDDTRPAAGPVGSYDRTIVTPDHGSYEGKAKSVTLRIGSLTVALKDSWEKIAWETGAIVVEGQYGVLSGVLQRDRDGGAW